MADEDIYIGPLNRGGQETRHRILGTSRVTVHVSRATAPGNAAGKATIRGAVTGRLIREWGEGDFAAEGDEQAYDDWLGEGVTVWAAPGLTVRIVVAA